MLWGIIFVLVLLQVATISYFISERNKGNVDLVETPANVAKVGEEYITAKDLHQKLLRSYGANVLQEMIDRKLIFDEAKRLNITVSEEEIAREIQLLRGDYGTEEEFNNILLEQIGITTNELKEEIEYYILAEEMATRDIVIEESQMKTHYDENIEMYHIPARFHLHTILVSTLEEAYKVIDEIKQGSSFEAVAAERSIDLVTSPNGGDLGMVTEDDYFLAEEVRNVASTLPINQLSEPISTEEGYMIIKVSEKVEGSTLPYEKVKGKIRRELALKQIDGVEAFLKSLRDQVGVENYLSGNHSEISEKE